MTQPEEHIVLNGSHAVDDLTDSLYEYIDTFILCPSCSKPETQMEVRNGQIYLHCSVCGETNPAPVKKATAEKMAAWLITHIKSEAPSTKGSTVAAQPRGKLDKVEAFQRGEAPTDGGTYINTDELERISKQLDSVQEQEAEKPKEMAKEDEDAFFDSFEKDCHGDASDADLYKRFIEFAEAAKLSAATRLNMLIQALFSHEPKDILKMIEKRRGLLIRATMEVEDQTNFLYMMSKFFAQFPILKTSAPVIWYCLFDNEVVEEGALKTWLTKPSPRFEKDKAKADELRNILKAFYQWLDEAPYEKVEEEEQNEEPEAQAAEDPIDIDAI